MMAMAGRRAQFRMPFCAFDSVYELPGTRTIPEQIAENKQPYYKALEAADESYKTTQIDASNLEELLEARLANQLVYVHQKATGKKLVI
jgi:hypothetical protein